jgi:hypothetical protein
VTQRPTHLFTCASLLPFSARSSSQAALNSAAIAASTNDTGPSALCWYVKTTTEAMISVRRERTGRRMPNGLGRGGQRGLTDAGFGMLYKGRREMDHMYGNDCGWSKDKPKNEPLGPGSLRHFNGRGEQPQSTPSTHSNPSNGILSLRFNSTLVM